MLGEIEIGLISLLWRKS